MPTPDLEPLRLLINNAPVDDFHGLSPTEMHRLLYTPFSDDSPVKVRTEISAEALETVPFYRLTKQFLEIVQREGSIKLTPLGALPRKVLVELYEYRIILDQFIERGITKLTRERDAVAIQTMRLNAGLAGLVRTSRGKLLLSKEGKRILAEKAHRDLFLLVFRSFVERFNWSYNDLFTEHPIGQLAWSFSLYLLLLHGDKPQSLQFYADNYARAFPALVEISEGPSALRFENWFAHCYAIRTFGRFLEWFGFVEVEHERRTNDLDRRVVRTQAMTDVFEFE